MLAPQLAFGWARTAMLDGDLTRRAELRVGQTLKGKWTLQRLLGLGGMAAVYAAVHRNGKVVAVKMLHAHLSFDEDVRKRFLREGYVANRVRHGGALTIDDDDVSEDGSAFHVMALLDGEPLDLRAQRSGGRLPVPEVLSLADQVLDTLIAAHGQGIVHRDLKPENLFLTNSGAVKILDFGIARLREISAEGSVTRSGMTLGTPAYMAPEQARGRWTEVDERTDLWAVGATMFTLLTGRYVHEAETTNEAVALAATQRARSLAALEPNLPPAIVQLVDRALKYEKEGRWQNAQAMQRAVRVAYESLTQSANAPGAKSGKATDGSWFRKLVAARLPSGPGALSRRRRTVIVASTIGGLFCIAGILAAVFVMQRRAMTSDSKPPIAGRTWIHIGPHPAPVIPRRLAEGAGSTRQLAQDSTSKQSAPRSTQTSVKELSATVANASQRPIDESSGRVREPSRKQRTPRLSASVDAASKLPPASDTVTPADPPPPPLEPSPYRSGVAPPAESQTPPEADPFSRRF
jgi:serine/threonine protein kinase